MAAAGEHLARRDDQLGRQIGEPLWPEWEGRDALERKRNVVGHRIWSALYQQSPRPLQGSLFNVSHIEIVDTLPAGLAGPAVRAWDLAATVERAGNDPDWTVGVKMLRDPAGRWIILDVVRLRGNPRQVEQAILQTATIDGRTVMEVPGEARSAEEIALLWEYLANRLNRDFRTMLPNQILSTPAKGDGQPVAVGQQGAG